MGCAKLAGGPSPVVLTGCMLVGKYVAGAPSLFVCQACISVEFVYGLVQPPSRCPKDLGKSVVTCNFRFVAGEGTGP